jgi:cytochrome b pre-mRNA-processing protein 3
MMSALGGRLGAYRHHAHDPQFRDGLIRNLWRGHPPAEPAILYVIGQVAVIQQALAAVPPAQLVNATAIPGA